MHIICCISTQTHTHARHNAHLYRCLTILLGDNLQKKCTHSTPTRRSNGCTLNEELATASCCTYHNQLQLLDCILLRTAGRCGSLITSYCSAKPSTGAPKWLLTLPSQILLIMVVFPTPWSPANTT